MSRRLSLLVWAAATAAILNDVGEARVALTVHGRVFRYLRLGNAEPWSAVLIVAALVVHVSVGRERTARWQFPALLVVAALFDIAIHAAAVPADFGVGYVAGLPRALNLTSGVLRQAIPLLLSAIVAAVAGFSILKRQVPDPYATDLPL